MKILDQYLVHNGMSYQILFYCEGGNWYITDTGAFGQRDMTIQPIHDDDAIKLLKFNKNP